MAVAVQTSVATVNEDVTIETVGLISQLFKTRVRDYTFKSVGKPATYVFGSTERRFTFKAS
jgi:hypothetical protein